MQNDSFDKLYKFGWLVLAAIFLSILWVKLDNNKNKGRYQFNSPGTFVLDTRTGQVWEVK